MIVDEAMERVEAAAAAALDKRQPRGRRHGHPPGIQNYVRHVVRDQPFGAAEHLFERAGRVEQGETIRGRDRRDPGVGVVNDPVDAEDAIVFDVGHGAFGGDVQSAIEIADPQPAARVDGESRHVPVGETAAFVAGDAPEARGPAVDGVNAVARHAVERTIGLDEALDRRRRLGDNRPRTPRQPRCQIEFGDTVVHRPDDQRSASNRQGAGEQPIANGSDVLPAVEFRNADGGSDEGPAAVHRN